MEDDFFRQPFISSQSPVSLIFGRHFGVPQTAPGRGPKPELYLRAVSSQASWSNGCFSGNKGFGSLLVGDREQDSRMISNFSILG